jgi:hypothetical protein
MGTNTPSAKLDVAGLIKADEGIQLWDGQNWSTSPEFQPCSSLEVWTMKFFAYYAWGIQHHSLAVCMLDDRVDWNLEWVIIKHTNE